MGQVLKKGPIRTGFVDDGKKVRLCKVCDGKIVESKGDSRSHWCVSGESCADMGGRLVFWSLRGEVEGDQVRVKIRLRLVIPALWRWKQELTLLRKLQCTIHRIQSQHLEGSRVL